MKKTIWILMLLILAIIIGFAIGMYLYSVENNEEQLISDTQNISYNNLINNANIVEIKTSVTEEKISVKTEVIEEIYYAQCDHLVRLTKKDIKGLINMTKEKLEKKYPDSEIKEFTAERVVMYKVEQGFCDEHYLVKDVDGFITIYAMDNDDNIRERIRITEIETIYLTKADQESLKEGIKVYTNQKLNKIIEDFE